jgi:hypothetical protein
MFALHFHAYPFIYRYFYLSVYAIPSIYLIIFLFYCFFFLLLIYIYIYIYIYIISLSSHIILQFTYLCCWYLVLSSIVYLFVMSVANPGLEVRSCGSTILLNPPTVAPQC